MTYDGTFSQEPTDREALENLNLAKKADFTDTQIDLMNQTLWVRAGHTLKDGAIFPQRPKNRYFKNQEGKSP